MYSIDNTFFHLAATDFPDTLPDEICCVHPSESTAWIETPEIQPPQIRKISRLTLCLLISLAVHTAAFVIHNPHQKPKPQPIIELALAFGSPHAPGNSDEPPGASDGQSPLTQSAAQIHQQTQAQTPPVSAPKTQSLTTKPHVPKKTSKSPSPLAKRIPKEPRPLEPKPTETPPPTEQQPTPTSAEAQASSTLSDARSENTGKDAVATSDSPESQTGGGQVDGGRTGAPGGKNGNGGHGSGGGDGQPFQFGSQGGPSFQHRVLPQYPRLAVARQEQGTVLLLLHIDATGSLIRAEIMTSAGPRLDDAALEAVKLSTYRPATVAGTAMPCKALLPIRFALKS